EEHDAREEPADREREAAAERRRLVSEGDDVLARLDRDGAKRAVGREDLRRRAVDAGAPAGIIRVGEDEVAALRRLDAEGDGTSLVAREDDLVAGNRRRFRERLGLRPVVARLEDRRVDDAAVFGVLLRRDLADRFERLGFVAR